MAEKEPMTTYEIVFRLVEKLGFPTVVSGCLLYGAWVFGDRVTDAHLTTLVVVQESIKNQTATLEKVAKSLDETVKRGDERAVLLRTILDEQRKTTNAIEGIK